MATEVLKQNGVIDLTGQQPDLSGKALNLTPATPLASPAPVPAPLPQPVIAPVASAPVAPVAPTPAPAAIVPTKSYTVNPGDTVASIALKFGVPITDVSGYRSGDPNKILPGENLTIGKITPPAPIVPPTATTPPVTTPTTPKTPAVADKTTPTLDVNALDPSSEFKKFFESVYGQNPDALQFGFHTNPEKTVKDLVTEVMTATGLPDANAQLQSISKEIEDLTNKQADEVQAINDNPWISASTKKARIDDLDVKYSQRIDARTNRLKLIQGAYDDARQQAQFAATTAINLYDKNRNFDQNRLESVMSEAQKFLDAQNKTTKRDTQVVESGNRKVLVDTQTGETIKDLGPVSSGTGITRSGNLVYSGSDYSADSNALEQSRGTDGWVDPAVFKRLYDAWVGNGGTSKDFIAKFPPKLYVNPANDTLPPILKNAGSGVDAEINALLNSGAL